MSLMIYALQGRISGKEDNFFVFNVSGIFFKILSSRRTISRIVLDDKEIKVFCVLYFKDDKQLELYGFLTDDELKFFELLTTVNGVGPKMALKVMDLGVREASAAISEKKSEFLARVPGVGRKTADRIVSELNSKLKIFGSKNITKTMQIDEEIEEVLAGLGFNRGKAKDVIAKLGKAPQKFEERLKKALKEMSK